MDDSIFSTDTLRNWLHSDEATARAQTPNQLENDVTSEKCFDCDLLTMDKCSRCGHAPDSADYLNLACRQDELPDDPGTIEDFGFGSFFDFDRKSKLLGLYQGLMYSVSSRTVHEWQVNGTLLDNIEIEYRKLPNSHRGGYFPWFLENRHLILRQPDARSQILEAEDKVKPYMNATDRALDPRTFPLKKTEVFVLYLYLLNGWHSRPENLEWFDFGFCTINEEQESSLAALYTSLIQTCTFDDVCKAFSDGRLIALMDAKGLSQERSKFKHLEAFLKGEAPFCVWYLNKYCQIKETCEPPKAVSADYGFKNCTTAKQRLDLKEFYKRLLQRCDLMNLHRACMSGKLEEFAGNLVKIDAGLRGLLKNKYPLPEV